MAVGLDLLGFPEVGEAAALISAAGYGLAATGDEIRGHYRAAAYESAIGAISALTAGIGSEALRAADYENPSLEMRVASRVTDLVRQAVGIGVWWAAHVVDESKYLPS